MRLQPRPDRLITDTVAKFNWDPKAVPFGQLDARSVGNARNARESPVVEAGLQHGTLVGQPAERRASRSVDL